MDIVGVVVLLMGAAVLVGLVVVYNHLVVVDQRRLQAEGDVGAQLSQRWDIVAQMAALVAHYMRHEHDLLTSLTAHREVGLRDKGGVGEEDVRSTVARFFARAESYPELRADRTFVQMQASIEEAEAQLAASRRALNAATAHYNSTLGLFPINLVGGLMGFKPAVFAPAVEGSTQRPDLTSL